MPISTVEYNTPTQLSLIAKGKTYDHANANVSLVFDPMRDTYIITNVSMSGGLNPLTGRDLREMPIKTRVSRELRTRMLEVNPELSKYPHVKAFLKKGSGRKISETHLNDPDDKLLEEVDLVYRLAKTTLSFPIVSVADTFGISRRAARALVRAAQAATQPTQSED